MRFNLIAMLKTAGCITLTLIVSQIVSAAEWSAEPSIRIDREYNNNPTLTTQPHNSAHGYLVAPKLILGARSEIWQVNSSAEYARRNYTGVTGLDRDDQFYTLGALFGTERSVWRVDSSLSRSSVLTNREVSPNTGLVQVNTIQKIQNISPAWIWSMDERKQLQLIYNYNSVSFVDGSSVGLSDYSSHGVTAQFMNQLDPLNQAFFSAGYSTSRTPEVFYGTGSDPVSIINAALQTQVTATESRSTVYQGGMTHVFSETSNGTLSVGLWNTSNTQLVQSCEQANPFYIPSLGGDPNLYPFFGPPCLKATNMTVISKQTSSVYSASLQKKFEKTRLDISFNRSFYPSGTGDQVRTDSTNFTISRSISSRLSANLVASSYNVRGTQTSFVTTNYDRTFYQIEPRLHWEWTTELSLDAIYRYTRLKYVTNPSAATSDSAYLTLTYVWPKMYVSR